MAGVKGRSGGARPNSGPKPRVAGAVAAPDVTVPAAPKNAVEQALASIGSIPAADPRSFLLAVMANPTIDGRFRIDAAKALMPYEYPKMGEHGKKTAKQDGAHKVAAGRYAPTAPPKLVVNNK